MHFPFLTILKDCFLRGEIFPKRVVKGNWCEGTNNENHQKFFRDYSSVMFISCFVCWFWNFRPSFIVKPFQHLNVKNPMPSNQNHFLSPIFFFHFLRFNYKKRALSLGMVWEKKGCLRFFFSFCSIVMGTNNNKELMKFSVSQHLIALFIWEKGSLNEEQSGEKK